MEIQTLEQVEVDHICKVLALVAGNRTHAAKLLGTDRRTLVRKIKRHNIDIPSQFDAVEAPKARAAAARARSIGGSAARVLAGLTTAESRDVSELERQYDRLHGRPSIPSLEAP